MFKHGDLVPSYYTYKKLRCRCLDCKAANAKYKRERVADLKALAAPRVLVEGDEVTKVWASHIRHGRANSYQWHGCHCEECTQAANRQRRLSKIRVMLRETEDVSINQPA